MSGQQALRMKCLAVVLVCVALIIASVDGSDDGSRAVRTPTNSPADVMAKNILEWIQGIYRQGVRKTRQQENTGYLPPYSTQRPPEKPRPFQSASPNGNEVTNYPGYQQPGLSGYTPQNGGYPASPPTPTYIPPNGQGSSFPTSTSYNPQPIPTSSPRPFSGGSSSFGGGFPATSTTYLPPSREPYPSSTGRPLPSQNPSFPTPTYGYPSPNPAPSFPTPGGGSIGYSSPNPAPSFPTPGGGSVSYLAPNPSPGFPTPGGGSIGYPSPSPTPSPGFPTPGQPSGPGGTTDSYGYPTPTPGFPTPGGGPSGPSTGGGTGTKTIPSTAGRPGISTGSPPATSKTPTGTSTSAGGGGGDKETTDAAATDDDDLKHPPHIHKIEVQCSKTMMTIDIEFNRNFDGVIYSKGFFMDPNCKYVDQNSGKKEYSFTVSLDSCGTQFINDFEGEAGQAYLENVLVLQNEPGIQEVWDTVRRVRCLWEGNINKALTVSLSVDMLNQEIVTFSGDTASAKLDIQIGKGPFAPAANGLVKIGETMTLVVSVEGDPAFDLQVRDCVARDESSTNVVQLTDEHGCILKPKLFGAFQKTNETGNTGASIIAYAFFQAFKFPDVMDLFIECNIELCKTDCEPCPEANQQIEPGRRRRAILYSNSSTGLIAESVRMGRAFRVIMPDDLSLASSQSFENVEENALEEFTISRRVCMSHNGFYLSFSLVLAILVTTTMSSAVFYTKLQRNSRAKNGDLAGAY